MIEYESRTLAANNNMLSHETKVSVSCMIICTKYLQSISQ